MLRGCETVRPYVNFLYCKRIITEVYFESGHAHLQITRFSQDLMGVKEEAKMAKADTAGGGYFFSFASAGSLRLEGPEVTLLQGIV